MARVSSILGLAILLGALALLSPPSAGAQQTKPHAEPCVESGWGYLRSADGEFATVNACNYSVDVWFAGPGGAPRQVTLAPSALFRSGLRPPTFDWNQDWMYAACQTGFAPNVAFSSANKDIIVKSQYACVKIQA
jgi:hypothetical protein